MQEAYENALDYCLQRDAALIYKAGKGIGTHDSLLIKVMAQRTKSQIEKIDFHYRELKENTSKRSLNEFLKAECSGDYLQFLKYVAKTRPKFLADQLSKAMDGRCILHNLSVCIFSALESRISSCSCSSSLLFFS